MGRNGMGRNGYVPKGSWAEMVMGRNDQCPLISLLSLYTCTAIRSHLLTDIIGSVHLYTSVFLQDEPTSYQGRIQDFWIGGSNL